MSSIPVYKNNLTLIFIGSWPYYTSQPEFSKDFVFRLIKILFIATVRKY